MTESFIAYDDGGLFRPYLQIPALTETLVRRLAASADPTRWLCEHITVDFSVEDDGAQRHADYDNPEARLRYTLQYVYAYGYEYYLMYRDVLHDMIKRASVPPVITITSIGCGNGVDYWGFTNACANMHPRLRELTGRSFQPASYRGIDKFDWSDCRFPLLAAHEWSHAGTAGSAYRTVDAAEYLNGPLGDADGACDSDVFVFPKSVNELESSLPDLERFFRRVACQSTRERIYLCVCPPHTPGVEKETDEHGTWATDGQAFQFTLAIARALNDGFELGDIYNGETYREKTYIDEHVKTSGTGWKASLHRTPGPVTDALERLGALSELCPARGTCEAFPCPVDRKPMLTARYISYHVVTFDRRERP